MLFGCKLRRTQKFPGTKQSIQLARSTAVRMPVSGLCAQDDRAAPGPACTMTGKRSVPTPGIAVHHHWALRAFLASVLIKTSCAVKSFIFIYLFFTALGLRCCARAFANCSELRLLFIAVRGLLIGVAFLVAEHGLWGSQAQYCCTQALEHRFSICSTQA